MSSFGRHVLLLVAVVILLWGAYRAMQALVLLFASIVLAVVLNSLARLLHRYLPGPYRLSLLAVVLGLVGLAVGFGYFLGPRLVEDMNAFKREVTNALMQVRETQMYKEMVGGGGGEGPASSAGGGVARSLLNATAVVASRLFDVGTGIVLVVVTAVFLAADPELYRRGVMSIFPPRLRDRVRRTLDRVGEALRSWLVAQGLSMLVIGVLTTIGMYVVGMKLALVLGLIAGLMQFIPYIGPTLAAVPAVLLAFADSPRRALYVACAYAVVQFLEGNFITPLILQNRAALPPALTLVATVAMGLILGPVGLLVATPVLVVMLVLYREVYQKDVLGVVPEADASRD